MKTKDQAFDRFKCYKSLVENQIGKKIKSLRSDRSGEYFSTEFTLFCENKSILCISVVQLTPHNKMVWIKEKIEYW